MLARLGRSLLASIAIATLTGCTPDSPPVETHPSGAPIVSSTTPLWKDGEGWTVDSQPVTVIGADDADPQQQWRWVEAAARLSNGNVVVGVEGSLRLFGPDGKFIRELAKAGDGPGEFRYIGGLLVLPGDSLRVHGGYLNGEVAVYGPDGSLAHESKLDIEKYTKLGRWIECRMDLLPDGSRIGCQADSTIPVTATNRPVRMVSEGLTSPGPGLYRALSRAYVVDPTLSAAHPLGINGNIEQFGTTGESGRETFIVHPFYSYSHLAAGGTPLRIVSVVNPEYEIEVWTPEGKLERVIRRPGGRRSPTNAEREYAREAIARRHKDLDPVTLDRIFAETPVPDSLPAAIALVVTSDGEILVQREGFLLPTADARWDVFDTQGRWLGDFGIAGNARIVSADGEHLLVYRRDAEERQLVEVYRLRR